MSYLKYLYISKLYLQQKHLQGGGGAVAEGATERGKVTYVSSRNTNADCFEGRGTIFTASKDIH
jgi:hypothetical protein